jgi:hypothetical protein
VRSPLPPKREGRVRSWTMIAAAAVIVVVAASLLRAPSPAPPSAAAEPKASVTLRFAVTPADADVILDGVRAGKASEPLVLPRSDRRSALRIEKGGFEAQTLWIVPDRDAELPPIALRAAPAVAAPPSGPSPEIGRGR